MAIPVDDYISGLPEIGGHGKATPVNGRQVPSIERGKRANGKTGQAGIMANAASLRPVELDDDKEPWERQYAEKINHYRWFEVYRDLETLRHDRSVREAYRQATAQLGRTISTREFRHCYKVWRWKDRADAWDEWVSRSKRHAYLQTIELMSARQARRGVLTANLGVTIIKQLVKRFKEEGSDLSFGELRRLFKPALDALETGQREERLARGVPRAVNPPEEEEEDIFAKVLNNTIELEDSPELNEAFQELEQVIIQTTKVTTTKKTSKPKQQKNLEPEDIIDSYLTTE